MSGFEVYDESTHKRLLDRFAQTDDGKLMKQNAHGGWDLVPERQECLVIPYNKDGDAEVW